MLVNEGPVGAATDTGSPTDLTEFKRNPKVVQSVSASGHASEIAKRNAMLERTRRYPPPVWGVFCDADEVLIHGELVPSLIWAAEQRTEPGNDVTAIPLLKTEVDGSVARGHRIIRLDRLERHVLSMSQMKFYGQDIIPIFPSVGIWRPGETVTETNRPPQPGEPHIHHRSYLRPPARSEYRLHKTEIADYVAQNRDAIAALGFTAEDGGTPVRVDRPEIIIAQEIPRGQ